MSDLDDNFVTNRNGRGRVTLGDRDVFARWTAHEPFEACDSSL